MWSGKNFEKQSNRNLKCGEVEKIELEEEKYRFNAYMIDGQKFKQKTF